jgi:hypothetical protein
VWHSSGEYAALLLETPVGRPLIRILDHFTLALVKGVEKGVSAFE